MLQCDCCSIGVLDGRICSVLRRIALFWENVVMLTVLGVISVSRKRAEYGKRLRASRRHGSIQRNYRGRKVSNCVHYSA